MEKFGVTDYDRYWDHRIAIEHYQFTKVHRKIIQIAREILGDREASILDCGVGPGHVFKTLSERYHAYGIEISKKAFGLYDFNKDRITLWDLNKGLPAYPEKMDLIVASRIIHHLEDPAFFLEQVKKNLKEKGWFLAVIPNICYYRHRLKYMFGTFPQISRAHINFQTGPDFEKTVASHGFSLWKLTTPKNTIRAKLWPTVFSQDLIYVFQKK